MKKYAQLGMVLGVLVTTVALHAMESNNPADEKRINVEVGLSGRQGDRTDMEDDYSIVLPLGDREDEAFFGVFDGHGGAKVAQFAAEDLYNNIINPNPDVESKDDESTLKNAFATTDNFLFKHCSNPERSFGKKMGATAVVAWVKPEKLIIGWIGDSRAVLADTNAQVVWESKDHKPRSSTELRRIRSAGGNVILVEDVPRVTRPAMTDQQLSLSRAFGDTAFKTWDATFSTALPNPIISAEPDVQTIPVQQSHNFLILACDGVWDVLSSKEAATIVQNALREYDQVYQKKTQAEWPVVLLRGNEVQQTTEHLSESATSERALYAAQRLRDTAYAKRSSDNISAMVILLDQKKQEASPVEIQTSSAQPSIESLAISPVPVAEKNNQPSAQCHKWCVNCRNGVKNACYFAEDLQKLSELKIEHNSNVKEQIAQLRSTLDILSLEEIKKRIADISDAFAKVPMKMKHKHALDDARAKVNIMKVVINEQMG